MVLRARWTGRLPVAGEYLMSEHRHTKYAYRIIEVEVCRDLPNVAGKRLKLHVNRISSKDVPDGATVWPWKWDARKKAGSPCTSP